MGRPARVLVTVREARLAVVVPAGESAAFEVDQILQAQRLQVALAAGIAERRRI